MHAYPEVLETVIELARAHHLPVRAISPEMRAALREAGIATPDCFSMAFYGVAATVETLIAQCEECPGGVLELMTHPGYLSPLPGSYREERRRRLDTRPTPAGAPTWRNAACGRWDLRIYDLPNTTTVVQETQSHRATEEFVKG